MQTWYVVDACYLVNKITGFIFFTRYITSLRGHVNSVYQVRCFS